jgi:hypothetical protein
MAREDRSRFVLSGEALTTAAVAVVPDFFLKRATPSASSICRGLTEGRLRLDRLPATAVANFFRRAQARFASRSKKAVAAALPLSFQP